MPIINGKIIIFWLFCDENAIKNWLNLNVWCENLMNCDNRIAWNDEKLSIYWKYVKFFKIISAKKLIMNKKKKKRECDLINWWSGVNFEWKWTIAHIQSFFFENLVFSIVCFRLFSKMTLFVVVKNMKINTICLLFVFISKNENINILILF